MTWTDILEALTLWVAFVLVSVVSFWCGVIWMIGTLT